MKKRTAGKRIGRVALWLTYPLYGPFARGYDLLKAGTDLARHLPEHTTESETTSPEVVKADHEERERARTRTRNYGQFCALLLILFVGLWLYNILWGKQSIFGPVCIQITALIAMLSGQFLFLSFVNWTTRQGRSGSFTEFMSNGRNLWPH